MFHVPVQQVVLLQRAQLGLGNYAVEQVSLVGSNLSVAGSLLVPLPLVLQHTLTEVEVEPVFASVVLRHGFSARKIAALVGQRVLHVERDDARLRRDDAKLLSVRRCIWHSRRQAAVASIARRRRCHVCTHTVPKPCVGGFFPPRVTPGGFPAKTVVADFPEKPKSR